LLEYLPPEDPIIFRLAAHARFAVVSYVDFDTRFTAFQRRWRLHKRRGLNWKRHQTSEEFCGAFRNAGYSRLASVDVPTGTRLWLWEANREV
jgi:hypothetical protein